MNLNRVRTLSIAAITSLASLAAFGAVGCSSGAADENQEHQALGTSSTSVGMQTKSIDGTFRINLENHDIKWEFSITKLDFTHRTAQWDAKVLERGGHPSLFDDVAVPMTIAVARCPGCFTFEASDRNGPLVRLVVSEGKVAGVTYLGQQGTALQATSSNSESESSGQQSGSSSSIGACTRICSGQPYGCKESVTKTECNASSFEGTPRCPTSFDFKAGGSCH